MEHVLNFFLSNFLSNFKTVFNTPTGSTSIVTPVLKNLFDLFFSGRIHCKKFETWKFWRETRRRRSVQSVFVKIPCFGAEHGFLGPFLSEKRVLGVFDFGRFWSIFGDF